MTSVTTIQSPFRCSQSVALQLHCAAVFLMNWAVKTSLTITIPLCHKRSPTRAHARSDSISLEGPAGLSSQANQTAPFSPWANRVAPSSLALTAARQPSLQAAPAPQLLPASCPEAMAVHRPCWGEMAVLQRPSFPWKRKKVHCRKRCAFLEI